MQALAAIIKHLKHTDDVKSHHWWQPADFEWLMQDKKGLWMNNHMPQILNNNFDVFSLSDFCHQPLILVSIADAGHILTITAISEFHCSQPLEFMIMPISTMPCGQWALTPRSALLTDLSLDLNQGQGSLQIHSFHGRIKNQSQSSIDDTRGWRNHKKHF